MAKIVEKLVERYFPLVLMPRNYREMKSFEQAASNLFASLPLPRRSIDYRDENLNRTFSILEHTKKGNLKKFIIIGAHYDTYSENCPGVNDNGSGVVAVLVLAKLFRRLHTHYSYKFVLFPNEEPPFFRTKKMGSVQYADHLRDKELDPACFFDIDCIGWWGEEIQNTAYQKKLNKDTKSNFLAFLYNNKAGHVVDHALDYFPGKLEVAYFPECDFLDMTDTFIFRERGFPVVNFSDSAFFRKDGLYHTKHDTLEHINISAMSKAISHIAGFLVHLDHEEVL